MPHPGRSLVRLLIQARQWWAILRSGEINSTELAAREGVRQFGAMTRTGEKP